MDSSRHSRLAKSRMRQRDLSREVEMRQPWFLLCCSPRAGVPALVCDGVRGDAQLPRRPYHRSPQQALVGVVGEHVRSARSRHIFLLPRLSFLPRLQVRAITIERIVIHVEDTWVARALAAIFAVRADR